MKLKRNLFALFSLTIFSLASILLCTSNYNPFDGNVGEFIQFYLSLFFSILGVSTLIIYFSKMKIDHSKSIYSFYWPSVRQGTFLALYLTILFFLQGLRLLDYWIAIPFGIIIVLLELFFQTKGSTLKNKELKI